MLAVELLEVLLGHGLVAPRPDPAIGITEGPSQPVVLDGLPPLTERKTISSSSRRLAGDRDGNQAPAPNASRASNRSDAGRRSKLALKDGKNAEINRSPGQFKPHASSTARSGRFTTPFYPPIGVAQNTQCRAGDLPPDEEARPAEIRK